MRGGEEKEKKEEEEGTTLPFVIFGEPTVETRWGKRQS